MASGKKSPIQMEIDQVASTNSSHCPCCAKNCSAQPSLKFSPMDLHLAEPMDVCTLQDHTKCTASNLSPRVKRQLELDEDSPRKTQKMKKVSPDLQKSETLMPSIVSLKIDGSHQKHSIDGVASASSFTSSTNSETSNRKHKLEDGVVISKHHKKALLTTPLKRLKFEDVLNVTETNESKCSCGVQTGLHDLQNASNGIGFQTSNCTKHRSESDVGNCRRHNSGQNLLRLKRNKSEQDMRTAIGFASPSRCSIKIKVSSCEGKSTHVFSHCPSPRFGGSSFSSPRNYARRQALRCMRENPSDVQFQYDVCSNRCVLSQNTMGGSPTLKYKMMNQGSSHCAKKLDLQAGQKHCSKLHRDGSKAPARCEECDICNLSFSALVI